MPTASTSRRSTSASGDTARFAGDFGTGIVRDLDRSAVLGGIAGQEFEADVDAPEGSGRVSFILTRRGIEEGAGADALPN